MAKQLRHQIGKRVTTGQNVLHAARKRVRRALILCDTPLVSFSGGKDSTVVLNLVVEEAERLGRLPVNVFFADEEIVAPETVAYMKRVAERPDIRLHWSCVPLLHRNACSHEQPWWYTWEPSHRADWARPRPRGVLTGEAYPDIPWTTIRDQTLAFFPNDHGKVIQFLGRRTQESLTRYRMIGLRRGPDAFMNRTTRDPDLHMRWADPIYDFSAGDVWRAIQCNGWDYNEAYDLFTALGIPKSQQRLAPPYGEEPSRQLWVWQRCWPKLWEKMQLRVRGADAGKRYARTGVYAYRDNTLLGPANGERWADYIERLILAWPEEHQGSLRRGIHGLWAHHAELAPGEPIPVGHRHKISGVSWSEIAQIAWRGYLKRRSLTQKTYGAMRKPAKIQGQRQIP